jgi:hypothetical protein
MQLAEPFFVWHMEEADKLRANKREDQQCKRFFPLWERG